MKYFGQYEDEIYAAGLRGVVPKLPIDIADAREEGDRGLAGYDRLVCPGGLRRRADAGSQRRGVREVGACPADDGRWLQAGHVDRALRHEAVDPDLHGPDRRHRHLCPGRAWGPRGGEGRRQDGGADGGLDADRRSARGRHARIRRHARLLPALYARPTGASPKASSIARRPPASRGSS